MIQIYLVFAVVLFLVISVLQDDLLEYQYHNYREEWKKDGCPRGFLFSPPRSSVFAYKVLGYRNYKRYEAALWIKNDNKAKQKYIYLRRLNRVWGWYCIGVFPVVIIHIMFFSN